MAYQRGEYGNQHRSQDRWRDREGGSRYGGGYRDEDRGSRSMGGYREDDDRGFFDRAGDEVRSWFGDEDANGTSAAGNASRAMATAIGPATMAAAIMAATSIVPTRNIRGATMARTVAIPARRAMRARRAPGAAPASAVMDPAAVASTASTWAAPARTARIRCPLR